MGSELLELKNVRSKRLLLSATPIIINLLTFNAAGAASPSPSSVLRNTDWELCGEPGIAEHHILRPNFDSNDQAIYLNADQSQITNNNLFNFSGDVDIHRADQQIETDKATYDKDADTVDATGNVRYQQGGLSLEADSAHVQLGTNTGNLGNSTFRLAEKHARGDASSIILEGRNKTHLKNARYTTCNPDKDDWYLHASDIRLNQETGVGTARNVWLEFKGVPFLYLPYTTFPIDDRRKSGFLAPSFGNSNEVGTELLTPYYWNISPNKDATITPRITSKRGVQLITEFRYLNPTNAGQLNVEYVPHDSAFGDDRFFISARHRGGFAPRWSTDINLNYVSDNNYFEQLGSSLDISSTTHLENRADVTYQGDFWSATGRLQSFQTIDETIPISQQPYQRLPQLLVSANLPRQWQGSSYLFDAEYVHFDRQDSVTADRIDIEPGISLPLRNSAGFITPTLRLRHTQYALDNEVPGTDSNPSRTLPIFSVDSGLTLERDASFGGSSFSQTLEPRLFYLYVPFRNQDDIPVFDTTLSDFNFTQLFQTNRFSGADREGDANQLALSLTTRFFNAAGAERFNASIGQIRYFRDRKVTLPGEPVETVSSSNIVAQAIALEVIPHLSAITSVQWDTRASRLSRTAFGVRYQPDSNRFVDVSYRFLNDDPGNPASIEELNQFDISALWPIVKRQDHRWNGVARWNYSLRDSRTLEILAGVEYDTCCWTFRIADRRFINNVDGSSNNSVFFQLELKGLASFGKKGNGAKGLEGLLDTNRSTLPLNDY